MRGAESVPFSSGEGVAAIVVTHESAATIDDCLARLRAARGVSQVRVVDNGSRDDTLAIVQRHAATDPRVHFIATPDNPGVAVARSEERRVGKEGGRPGRSWWSSDHEKKKNKLKQS